jgi:hypothetical protein
VLEAVKVLPKYLQEAIKKRDKEIMKQIEKLKTKPLRIAYKDIVRKFNELSDEELEKFIKTAYYEKMRYYAKRIADTETHRAAMSKRAREYLNDENIEFVRFEMSAAHPKIDICDFYANLDIGYGRGIVPKSEMRTLPLHPHCRCVYSPYYGKVKGRRKDWNKAVRDTMSKYNEAQQREILGTYDMLNRFKGGEDIESIFNTVRPKYPIRKYVDVFGKMSKSFKEDFLNLNKVGYFDEEFEKLSLKKICKKVDIDIKDIEEIAKKTNFEVEGAVYYRSDGKRVFVSGEKNKIEIPFARNINKLIHSHPKGTSFSVEDVISMLDNKIFHIVAFSDEYFYSLKVTNFNFDFDERFFKTFNKYDKILSDKVQRGEITQSQKDFAINHKVWKTMFKEIKGVKYDYYRIRKKT